jgi:iron-sulfur cluster insertion protein
MEVTPAAVKKVAEIVSEYEEDNLGLRISVKGGGCSGFQYHFELDHPTSDDLVADLNENVQLMIDAMSNMYLDGATLDYKDDPLNGSAFTISNPNAKTSCGCGSSFSA